jgi:hypothetical protein
MLPALPGRKNTYAPTQLLDLAQGPTVSKAGEIVLVMCASMMQHHNLYVRDAPLLSNKEASPLVPLLLV